MNSQTLERPSTKQQAMVQGSHTLGKTKKSKNTQRLSAGNIDYDNISQEADEPPASTFRSRSKTVGDTAGGYTEHKVKYSSCIFFIHWLVQKSLPIRHR